MYNFVDSLGIFSENAVEHSLEVVFLRREVFIAGLNLIDKSLGDNFAPPAAEIDGLSEGEVPWYYRRPDGCSRQRDWQVVRDRPWMRVGWKDY